MRHIKNNIKRYIAGSALLLLLFFVVAIFVGALGPPDPVATESKTIKIEAGEGFSAIAEKLEAGGIIKSSAAFKLFALMTGSAGMLKPGRYNFLASANGPQVLSSLVSGPRREASVVIYEGWSVYEIDQILAEKMIIENGSLIDEALKRKLEGKLFPDTYQFFTSSEPEEIIDKMLANFDARAKKLFDGAEDAGDALIVASLVEKEVPEDEDRRIVAGILKKRLRAGMPLQVDATICYVKKIKAYPAQGPCYPLSPLDFKAASDYNTYLHTGLPPQPISNPGLSAIQAVLEQEDSPYWYYLSDPATRRTIFSKTLEEHNVNRAKYLGL